MNWFLSSEIKNGLPEESLFHIIPVPFEESIAYGPGSSRGPQAVIEASSQLELAEPGIDPSVRGIYTAPALIKRKDTPISAFFERLETIHLASHRRGKVPIVLGGEHALTFAGIKACSESFDDLGVICFDAHADLREEYEGSRYSHGCVMRRVSEELQLPIMEVGIRAYSPDESDYIDELDITVITGSEADAQNLREIHIPEDFPQNVFITFDVDALDPSIMPATGAPVPGGLLWYQTLEMLESIAEQRRIVSFDMMELAPIQGLHFCEFTIAQLCYHIMTLIAIQNTK